MPDHVLTARIYFVDEATAINALAHLEALADHSAAQARVIGGTLDPSWARVHVCHATVDGDTAGCQTVDMWTRGTEPPDDGDVPEWAPGQDVEPGDHRSYDGTVYVAVQGHTTQAGWEPPDLPALWQPA